MKNYSSLIATHSCTILTGYYGVGKTNLALNLALMAARSGDAPKDVPVVLVDLDVVNPYFRSSDYPQVLAGAGVELLAPTFARTTLESPSLPASIGGAFTREATVILDVGGDDAGATMLGRYRSEITTRAERGDYAFLYVVNRFRSSAAEAAEQLRAIEDACGLQTTGIVNNSHMQAETDLATVAAGLAFGEEVAALVKLPLIATTVPVQLFETACADPAFAGRAKLLLPIETLVTTPWQNGQGGQNGQAEHEQAGQTQ